MLKKVLLAVLAVLILVFGIVAVIAYVLLPARTPVVSTYEECVAAGYPILESYPEQCLTPKGVTFVNPNVVVGGGTLPTSTPNTNPPTIKDDIHYKDLIQIAGLREGQIITSPLTLTGEARGTWYFEASFPIRLVDGKGKQIAVVPAQAQGNWMTEEYVPFRATLSFTAPTATSTGYLIFERDNPSGLPEHADELRVPVRFR